MQAEREVVRFLSVYQTIWHAHFPRLFRRAQWHIVTHLCTSGREGAAVGELYGLVKQVFLLDDSTVKERILEIQEQELCEADPPTGALSARTVIAPTRKLLELYDRHLLALAKELCVTAAALDPATRAWPPRALNQQQRGIILQSIACYREPWRAALDRLFDARTLSKARRVEAIRHLSSLSHWTLLHMAVEQRYGVSQFTGGDKGILADQMAATLLNLTGQNFQTTRDHIAYLISLGLFERQTGKSLRVALSEEAAKQLHQALGEAAASLPGVARSLADSVPESDRHSFDEASGHGDASVEVTLNLRPGALTAAQQEPRHYLVIVKPASAQRRIALLEGSLTIGRVPPCDLLLETAEVSRAHCRIDVAGDEVFVTDLKSTNGTIVDNQRIEDKVELAHGATLQVGSYVMTCEYQSQSDAAVADRTQRRVGGGNVTALRARRSRPA